ncbi:hypothetical protein G3N55_11300, partial [Dissulfurirhabdus thermomarina]
MKRRDNGPHTGPDAPSGHEGLPAPRRAGPPELPSQQDLEREISDYLAKKYGGRVRVVSQMVLPEAPGVDQGGG